MRGNEKGTLYFSAFLDELEEPDAWNGDCSSNLAGIVLGRLFLPVNLSGRKGDIVLFQFFGWSTLWVQGAFVAASPENDI